MVGTHFNSHDARRVRPSQAAPKTAPPSPRVSTRLVVSRREYSNLQCGAGEIAGVVVDATDRLEHWPVLWMVLARMADAFGIKASRILGPPAIPGAALVTDPLFVLLCRLALEHVEVDE